MDSRSVTYFHPPFRITSCFPRYPPLLTALPPLLPQAILDPHLGEGPGVVSPSEQDRSTPGSGPGCVIPWNYRTERSHPRPVCLRSPQCGRFQAARWVRYLGSGAGVPPVDLFYRRGRANFSLSSEMTSVISLTCLPMGTFKMHGCGTYGGDEGSKVGERGRGLRSPLRW
ncbi:hypothetical protein CALCODRAFT_86703 [Calocera cornea HHB12733]|uniref:Uncharacterized protein n=1 Tax=Calocera cornea HHB12733 TaxID=1353952 RepID=A0A165DCR9_9BASI|nr:hypothetical protein CALCODRAFT_86703 [Calocera cornea HHB12733]